MDLNNITVFVERFGSFAIIIGLFWVAIRYVPKVIQNTLDKFDVINERNNATQKDMQEKYTNSLAELTQKNTAELSRISENFQKSVENSTSWHQKHSQDIADLRNFIVSKYK